MVLPNFSNAIKINNPSIFTRIIGPPLILVIPMLQRLNYFINMFLRKDYNTYLLINEKLNPLVYKTIAVYSAFFFKPSIVFRGITEEEFAKDMSCGSHLSFSNHVSYADSVLGLQLAIKYGFESRLITFLMKQLKYWPFIGPSLLGQLPMSRDKTGKDLELIKTRIEMYKKSGKPHMFVVFPEGSLRKTQTVYERTCAKNKQFGLNLQYMHYPKTNGFLTLIDNMGSDLKNIYKYTLFYEHKKKKFNNPVYICVEKVCKASELPEFPTEEFVTKHELEIDDSNRRFYALEEFLLQHFIQMDTELADYYNNIKPEDRPTIENYHKWYNNSIFRRIAELI